MTRYLVLIAFLAACGRRGDTVDSADAALPAIDTLKPVTVSDRDSAFPPPRNLPQLDTVKKKPD